MPTPKAQIVKLSEMERHQVGQQIALRARIVLAAVRGETNERIAQVNNVTSETVRLWRNRWVKLQDIALDDLSLKDRLADAPGP